MLKPFPAALHLALAGLVAGCAPWSDRAPSLPDARCRAAGAAAYLDRPATDTTANEAMLHAGAIRRQVVPYGGPPRATDVDPQRLNIEVDAGNVIRRLRCG